MSFDAIRWAMEQPVKPAITKFVLVAMAECVNSSAGVMECWPSYAHLARRTGASKNTVEASVYRLREERYIVDTGRREGGTGKVPVYRLNDPTNGGVMASTSNAEDKQDASAARAQTTPHQGRLAVSDIPPNLSANPPKSDLKSPQKHGVTTPDLGSGIRKESGKRTRKEPGIGAAAVPGVAPNLLADWLAVRKDKKAGTLTETAVDGLQREAAKAGLTNEQAVRYCIEANWVGFNAGFYANREGKAASHTARGQGQSAADRTAEAARLLGIGPTGTQETIDA